jgi:hypothetical protein
MALYTEKSLAFSLHTVPTSCKEKGKATPVIGRVGP